MKRSVGVLSLCGLLGACGSLGGGVFQTPVENDGQTRPSARPDSLDTTVRRPPGTARTVDEFDTTTAEERAAASASAADTKGQALGTTIVSLGDPAQPGFWLETALVRAPGKGRVLYPATGEQVQVDLRPLAEGGSRLSLPAMRLLGVSLTELVEVEVFSEG